MNGAGESESPFSQFANVEALSELVTDVPKSASPTTVTNVVVLPSQTSKKALKSYLREKLFPANHDIRSVLYKRLVKRIECNEQMFSKTMYKQFIEENFSEEEDPIDIPLPGFVGKEMLPLYCLNHLGKGVLNKIMACVHSHFPHITYSPLLPVATVLLLLYDDDPAQVFTHVCHLIFANARHCQYLDITEEDNAASSKVLRELSQRYAAGSHKSLLNLTSTPDQVYGQWLRCLFQGLPFSFVVILFDMYLLEGYKALYRVSLAILRFYRKSGVSNAENIMDTVFEFVRGIESKVQPAVFFKKAFNFKLPSSKEIFKLHRSIMFRYKSDFSMISKGTAERTPWNYLRVVKDTKSDIVDETLMSNIYCWIPANYAEMKPNLLFSTNRNGYSIHSFYSCIEEESPTLMLIKTTDGDVFGAFCSEPWEKRRTEVGYFGTGQTFIFTLRPHRNIYRWVGLDEKKVEADTLAGETSSNGVDLEPATSPSCSLPLIHKDVSNQSILSQSVVGSSDKDPLILPPLVPSNHSLANSRHALSRGSSADSSPCGSQRSNSLIDDLNVQRCSGTNLSAGGTFEEIPHFADEVQSTSSGAAGTSHQTTDTPDEVSPSLSPSKEFSKENLPKLVEEGYKPSRRYSTLPEDSPLTSAIENIFDSSRKASCSNEAQSEEEEAKVAPIAQAVNFLFETLAPEQQNDSEDTNEQQEFETKISTSNTNNNCTPTAGEEGATDDPAIVRDVESNTSTDAATPLVSARTESSSPPAGEETAHIPENETQQSNEAADETTEESHPTLCTSPALPHIEITPEISSNPPPFPPLTETVPPPTPLSTPPRNDLFMMANESGFAIGGGGGGYGIFIDSALNSGTTQYCSTFSNKPLVKGGQFMCSVIEVFSFGTPIDC